MKIIFATNNIHKLDEVKAILGSEIEVQGLKEIGLNEEVEETGSTFEENARLKAQAVFHKIKVPCLSDDSGLEVEALGNAPGVYSARFAGEPVDHEKNIDKLLKSLNEMNNRKARFRTVLCYIDAEGKEEFFTGTVEGYITHEQRGEKGFGYDPVFIPNGYDKTFAQMSSSEKNSISHRARALEKFKQYIER
jgi:XTP/dITP diphosphohydrolase